MSPRLEQLEALRLLATSTMIQTITEPTLSVSNVLTNFGLTSGQPAVALSPTLPLFDPRLGSLVDVRVTETTNLTSFIRAQNISTASGASITATLNGQTQLAFNGTTTPVPPITSTANQTGGPVTVAAYTPGGAPINYSPPSGVSFDNIQQPALSSSTNQTLTYSDPTQLAFFTASASRSSIPVLFSALASATASSPNGNLTSQVSTPASATVTVSYDYTPACPMPTRVVRFGVHHQQTQLVVSLSAAANPIDANNPNNYTILTAGAEGRFDTPDSIRIPVASASYNARNDTVTLVPVQRLNVHYKFELAVNYPCYNGTPATVVFGTKYGLGGFTGGHHKTFFPVVGGHLVRRR